MMQPSHIAPSSWAYRTCTVDGSTHHGGEIDLLWWGYRSPMVSGPTQHVARHDSPCCSCRRTIAAGSAHDGARVDSRCCSCRHHHHAWVDLLALTLLCDPRPILPTVCRSQLSMCGCFRTGIARRSG